MKTYIKGLLYKNIVGDVPEITTIFYFPNSKGEKISAFNTWLHHGIFNITYDSENDAMIFTKD